jgi:hypothetical protein
MDWKEFEQLVLNDEALQKPLRRAAEEMQIKARGDGALLELAAIAALFPMVSFIIKHIGLPWLHEATRYSELWRHQFGRWIDEQYRRRGVNPAKVEAAGERLRKELELLEIEERKSWEKLTERIKSADKSGD